MHKIWLGVAAFCLAAPVWGAPAARADAPALAPGDHVLGNAEAPITVIEYASPTCPHCAEFDRDTLPKLKAEWIDTGKAKLAFRVFPLNQLDVRVAQVASCVPADHYFGFIGELYHSQDVWARSADPVQAVANIGRLAGVSDAKIKSCLADGALEKGVVGDAYAAQQSYGVQSTPTFFVNGSKVEGALPYDSLNKVLTAALPKS